MIANYEHARETERLMSSDALQYFYRSGRAKNAIAAHADADYDVQQDQDSINERSDYDIISSLDEHYAGLDEFHAQEEAAESDLDADSDSLSHDLSQPLLKPSSTLAQQRPYDAQTQQHYATIQDSSVSHPLRRRTRNSQLKGLLS